jgi:hypothetical protein
MATHDYVIDNQSASAFRADLNSALQAIVTQNSSGTAPTTTYANMIWYDTADNQLKKRNEADSAWIVLGTIDESTGTFTPSGERALASQVEAEAGTDNTKLMTPLRTSQAIAALTGIQNIVVRTSGTSFTVPAGVTKMFVYAAGAGGGGGAGSSTPSSRGVPATTNPGGSGGMGGFALSLLPVTPGSTINYTIGAGGVGNNSSGTSGSSGGSTTVDTITCTGGGGGGGGGGAGANGTGSGGNLSNGVVINNLIPYLTFSAELADELFLFSGQAGLRGRATSSTAAISYAYPGSFIAGAGGQGELGSSGNNAVGGVGGGIVFMY